MWRTEDDVPPAGQHVTLRGMPRPIRRATQFEPASEAKRQAGLRLRAARLALELTADRLAEAIGVTRSALTAYETGQNMADPLAMARLLRRFDIAMEWVYAGEIRNVRDYAFQELLLARAAELGAVVGAPCAEFPMQVDHTSRQPGQAPARPRKPGATLHEPQKPLEGGDQHR